MEEAAEVLESHIVASFTRDCQHLILIGKCCGNFLVLIEKSNLQIDGSFENANGYAIDELWI